MSLSPSEFHVFVRRNPKLSFKDVESTVLNFIERRLQAFGLTEYTIINPDDSPSPKARFTVIIDSINPFTDFEAVFGCAERLEELGLPLGIIKGAIPGTEPQVVIQSDCTKAQKLPFEYSVATQERFNNQLNLRKFKRMRTFLNLRPYLDQMAELKITELNDFLEDHHEEIISYGNPTELTYLERCPHCSSSNWEPLRGNHSQPMIGFVTTKKSLYYRCEQCGLGFMTPHVKAESTAKLYDEFDSRDSGHVDVETLKAQGFSPKQETAVKLIETHLIAASPSVMDLGGGTGRFSSNLKKVHPDWRVTHTDLFIERKEFLEEMGVQCLTTNFVTSESLPRGFDVITAFEVVEHMDYDSFRILLSKVHRSLNKGGLFLFTTPDLDSPLTQAFDFFNAYAPHHLLIFGRHWVECFFGQEDSLFFLLEMGTGGDIFLDDNSFFKYYSETSPTFQDRGGAKVLYQLLKEQRNINQLLAQGIGTELIAILRKK